MKIENGKIMEATKRELYQRWLDDGWDMMMPFEEYVYHLKSAGVEVKEESND
jgi:hypothetical protein